MSDDNSYLPYDTWRNIAVGRSNVYEPFIKIHKDLERDLFYCPNINSEEVIEEKEKPNEEKEEVYDGWRVKKEIKS